jgi:hypothetical protein
MGTITRNLSNNITTGGVILPAGITNATVANITSFPNASGGTLTLLSTQTASNSATISFTTGIDSTYDEYIFKFIDVHPRTDSSTFQFNMSSDGGSNYNVTKTSTVVYSAHTEDNSVTSYAYDTGADLGQSTSFQSLAVGTGNDADQTAGGSLTIFNPSSTTYVKHYIGNLNSSHEANYSFNWLIGGYGNTTSAINAVRFQFSSGNFDGIIKMYGVKKS